MGTTTGQTSTSTLFSDPFNSCVHHQHFNSTLNPQWVTTGDVEGDNHGSPHGLVAFLSGKPTSSMTSIGVSTVGYHNITLKCDRNLDVPAGTTASLTVEYSVNGGGAWMILESFTADSAWTTKTWNLSPSADNKAAIKIRFTFAGTSNTDHGYVDNVSITGVTP